VESSPRQRENVSVASAPTPLELVTLGIAVWGAGFSTYLGVAKRRRRLLVGAEWGTDRLGSSRNHAFWIVSVVNIGERAVAVREVEWVVDERNSCSLHIFRHCKDKDLPVKVEPDGDLRILVDFEHAASAIAPSAYGAQTIKITEAARKRMWEVALTDDMRDEAEEETLRQIREEQDQQDPRLGGPRTAA
jgi:hypothetical protein